MSHLRKTYQPQPEYKILKTIRDNANLEYGSCDQTFKKSHGSREQIVDASSSCLEQTEEEKWNKERDQGCCPDGYNFLSQWICELGIHDLAVLKENRKRSTRRWRCTHSN